MHPWWDYRYYDRRQLPDDKERLKDCIDELVEVVHQLQQEVSSLKEEMSPLKEKIEKLEQGFARLQQDKYGRKSEKQPKSAKGSSAGSSPKASASTNHPGRNPLPTHLKRQRQEHDLPASEKTCAHCQQPLTKIQEIISEQLEVIPAQVIVKEQVRFQYACRCCGATIKTAELPAQAIEKGRAGAGLLAQVIVDKYGDHLPLYRQRQRFLRSGVKVSVSTLYSWLEQAARALKPLVEAMKEEMLISDHLFSDDTPVRAIEAGRGQTKESRFWTYVRPLTKKQGGITVYEYTPTRQGKHPQQFLKRFKGYLQTDAYTGYDALHAANQEGQVVCKEVGCWAHSRRKFVEIVKKCPESIATIPIAMIGELYALEKEGKQLTPAKRRRLRRGKAQPILDKLLAWLKEHQPLLPEDSELRKAINYTLNQWSALTIFLEDGRLEIDNNTGERAMKPIAIGRKNYLFIAGPGGGETAEILYSLLESCRQNKVEPLAYLTDVLPRLATHPHKRIKELLPHYWKPSIVLSQAA